MRPSSRVLLVGLLIVLVVLWFIQRNGSNDRYKNSYLTLSSVAALSTHQVWSVGSILPTGEKSVQPFIASWNGSSWRAISSPPAPDQTLSAVTVISAHDVWAVGSVIEHWDGTRWHLIPHAAGFLTSVAAVAADNVWAVGTQVDTHYERPKKTFIEHWDGTSWKVVRSPNDGQGDNFLTNVAVVSATDIWAVGGFEQPFNDNRHLLIEHWDGSTWSLVPTPTILPTGWVSNFVTGLSVVSQENIWAVGGSVIPLHSKYQVLLLHWNGKIWQQIPSPRLEVTGCCVGLSDVTAISATDIWAVGASDPMQPLIMHWNGKSWSVVASPPINAGELGGVLSGVVAISADDIWAVGTADITNISSRPIIEHWDGKTWQRIEGLF